MLYVKATLREEIIRLEEYFKVETNDSILIDLMSRIEEHKEAIRVVENLNIPIVSDSLPTENKMDLGQWMEHEGIKPDGYGGLTYRGQQFTAHKIEQKHKAYRLNRL